MKVNDKLFWTINHLINKEKEGKAHINYLLYRRYQIIYLFLPLRGSKQITRQNPVALYIVLLQLFDSDFTVLYRVFSINCTSKWRIPKYCSMLRPPVSFRAKCHLKFKHYLGVV